MPLADTTVHSGAIAVEPRRLGRAGIKPTADPVSIGPCPSPAAKYWLDGEHRDVPVPNDALRRSVRAVVIRWREYQVLAHAEVPVCSENIMCGVRQFLAQPYAPNPGNVEIGKQTRQNIQFVPTLKVRATRVRRLQGLSRSRQRGKRRTEQRCAKSKPGTPFNRRLGSAFHG